MSLELTPERPQRILLRHAQRELLAERVVCDARVLAQGLVDVLGTHADAPVLVERERLRIDRDRELLLVGRADHAVALDAAAEKQDRADRPVILAVALVVVRRPAHLALD